MNVEAAVDDMIALLEALEQDGHTATVALSTLTTDELRDTLAATLIASWSMFEPARSDESLADLWRRRRADLIRTITTITNGGDHGGSH